MLIVTQVLKKFSVVTDIEIHNRHYKSMPLHTTLSHLSSFNIITRCFPVRRVLV